MGTEQLLESVAEVAHDVVADARGAVADVREHGRATHALHETMAARQDEREQADGA